jgi:hypothetical protein
MLLIVYRSTELSMVLLSYSVHQSILSSVRWITLSLGLISIQIAIFVSLQASARGSRWAVPGSRFRNMPFSRCLRVSLIPKSQAKKSKAPVWAIKTSENCWSLSQKRVLLLIFYRIRGFQEQGSLSKHAKKWSDGQVHWLLPLSALKALGWVEVCKGTQILPCLLISLGPMWWQEATGNNMAPEVDWSQKSLVVDGFTDLSLSPCDLRHVINLTLLREAS